MSKRHGRPYRRKVALSSPLRLLLILLLIVLGAWRYWDEQNQPGTFDELTEGPHRVERVVDGDTLKLANKARIRLIGADTPETVKPNHPVEPWGPEATDFTNRFIGDEPVRLEFDGDRKDRFDRHLALVWVGDRMLNEELIRAGLARARTEFPYSQSKKRLFRQAEDEAKAAGRGIWSGSPAGSR
ncbi:MAG TPA: thermonuclease [Planctomycetaceae bacterium]|nr:thermonuclease [Planctomycetaceae bacterium]